MFDTRKWTKNIVLSGLIVVSLSAYVYIGYLSCDKDHSTSMRSDRMEQQDLYKQQTNEEVFFPDLEIVQKALYLVGQVLK